MIAVKPCCESCTHYLQISDPTKLGNKEGECRRYPPQSVAIHVAANQIKILSHFPHVQPSQVCGEHAAFAKNLAGDKVMAETVSDITAAN